MSLAVRSIGKIADQNRIIWIRIFFGKTRMFKNGRLGKIEWSQIQQSTFFIVDVFY